MLPHLYYLCPTAQRLLSSSGGCIGAQVYPQVCEDDKVSVLAQIIGTLGAVETFVFVIFCWSNDGLISIYQGVRWSDGVDPHGIREQKTTC